MYTVYEDEPSEASHLLTVEQQQQHAGSHASGDGREDPSSSGWFCSPTDYETYLSRSLPARVQRELERQVQQEFGFYGDAAQTRRVVDVVQKMQLRLFQQFRQEREGGGGGGALG